jgi:hypothetical protein
VNVKTSEHCKEKPKNMGKNESCVCCENVLNTGRQVQRQLILCFNYAPHYEDVLGEWMYSSTHSLTSALDGGEWSASGLSHFTPGKEHLVPIG